MTEDKIENTCDDLKNALLGLYENGDNDEDRKTVHATQKEINHIFGELTIYSNLPTQKG